jgi:hypothetical protein
MIYGDLRVPLEGDTGIEAQCPDECMETATCGLCSERCCPIHGVPVTVAGEQTPEDSFISSCASAGPVHRACHQHNCRSRHCFEDD